MKLPSDPNKYTSKFKYVEIAKYVLKLNQVIREKKDDKPLLIPIEEASTWAAKHKNMGIYTSVFQYNSEHFDGAQAIAPLYFDIDSPDIAESHSDAIKLVKYLQEYMPRDAIRIYFSGKKGFHIECEPIALGISPSDDLTGVFKYIARDLEAKLSITTFDFGVYDPRRMWRLPYTLHQKSGRYKSELITLDQPIKDILRYAEQPDLLEVPEQSFSAKANEWYREYIYNYEETTKPSVDTGSLLERFLKSGSGTFKPRDDVDKIFDPIKLFEGCPAILLLWEKAEKTHDLSHLERLFLCSILTYTEESIDYLHTILGQCNDYKREITDAHINDWVKRRENNSGGRPVTCQKAKEWGIICSGCDGLEPHKKTVKLDDNTYYATGEESLPSPVRLAYSYEKRLDEF